MKDGKNFEKKKIEMFLIKLLLLASGLLVFLFRTA